MRYLCLLVLCATAFGCFSTPRPKAETKAEEPSTVCDVTKDLNNDGCNDAVCRMLVPEGDDLNGVVVTEDLVIETRYFGSCENPQDLVLNPACEDDLDVTEGDGCSSMFCQLPGGAAVYICE